MSTTQASQQFVPIKEVRDGVAVLEDGSYKMILMASSVNMSLKSPDEQQSVLVQFQNFLNSLDFSVQIYVQSRRYDVRPYIALLERREKEQINDLAKVQIREYISFIKTFTKQTNIMTKNFFIIVPYTPSLINTNSGLLSNILGIKKGGGGKKPIQL
jgi:conjugal transfer ATP-binding protein TraC